MGISKRKYAEQFARSEQHKVPNLELLHIAELTIDPSVQRRLQPDFVNRIINEFQPEMLGVLQVSERADGTKVLIDGQHRHAAASYLAGETAQFDGYVQCHVFRGLSLQEEAALFRHLNFKLNMTSIDEFLVRITEREPIATGINFMAQENGWTISRNPGDGNLAAVRALEKVYKGNARLGAKPDMERVRLVLEIVTAAWGHADDAAGQSILHGLGLFLMKYADRADLVSLTNRLAKHSGGPGGLLGQARGLKDFLGSDLANCVAETLLVIYNARRRTGQLPAWRS